jgi:hypothetical protein
MITITMAAPMANSTPSKILLLLQIIITYGVTTITSGNSKGRLTRRYSSRMRALQSIIYAMWELLIGKVITIRDQELRAVRESICYNRTRSMLSKLLNSIIKSSIFLKI